ncbi:MAG: DUF1684 domain-containing protein [Actinomycetota bacterium]
MTDRPADIVELLDWKRRMFDLYRRIRESTDVPAAWEEWKRTRDELFAKHPQSPLPASERAGFRGLSYFDYDPAARVLADIEEAEPERLAIASSTGGVHEFTRLGRAAFELRDERLRLDLYWLEGYGGGLFLPIRDQTSGSESYGSGRYLLDTVKGADLGMEGSRLVLDFNFAYSPSCCYDGKWDCPLTPPANRLPVPVRAGERI